MTCPDSEVFCSNYPQPEFIFRLQSGQPFIASEFVVRSNAQRVHNGVPIAQGLIFASECLEDIMNTKQYLKMSEQELKLWWNQRTTGHMAKVPFLPSEPIAYFDLDDKLELTIDARFIKNRPINYVKLMPTAFRRKPVNFSSKAFNANQVEFSFFGINGNEVALRNACTNTVGVIAESAMEKLNVPITIEIEEPTLRAVIGSIKSVTITELKNAKASHYASPLTALSTLKLPNVVGVAKVSLPIGEDHADSIKSLAFGIIQSHPTWKLTGVTVGAHSYTDQSAIFASPALQQSKPKTRQYLLDIANFDKLLGKLLTMAQSVDQVDDKRIAALICIMNFLASDSTGAFTAIFRERSSLPLFFTQDYLSKSTQYQQVVRTYLDKLGLFKSSGDFIGKFLSESQIPQILAKVRPASTVKHLFDLIPLASLEWRETIAKQLISILKGDICESELVKLQTPEYIALRSLNGIDGYPFDEVCSGAPEQSQLAMQSASVLACEMQMYKYSSLYHYDVDFGKQVLVERLRLLFDQDDKSYKVLVKVIAPSDGGEEIVYKRQFDENLYSQVTEKAHKHEVKEYFGPGGLNAIVINFPSGYLSRYIRLQVELLDTHKSVYKLQPLTGILIKPEFFGQIIGGSTKQLSNFELKAPKGAHIITQTDVDGVVYDILSIKGEAMSQMNKACHIRVNKGISMSPGVVSDNSDHVNIEGDLFNWGDVDKETEVKKETKEVEDPLKQLPEKREELRELLLKKSLKGQAHKQNIKNLVEAIEELTKGQAGAVEGKLTLRYLLRVSELIADQVIASMKTQVDVLSGVDLKALYSLLFERFTINDVKGQHLSIQALQAGLIEKVEGSSTFMNSLVLKYLFPESQVANFSLKNLIAFTHKQAKQLDFNDFVDSLFTFFGVNGKEEALKDIDGIITELSFAPPVLEGLTFQSIITLISLLENLETKQSSLNISKYLQLFTFLAQRSPSIVDTKNKNGQVSFKYFLQTVYNLTCSEKPSINEGLKSLASSNIKQLASFTMLSIQRNDQEVNKNIKDILTKLSSKTQDGQAAVKDLAQQCLSWYKDNTKLKTTPYYANQESSRQGKGSGAFYKHMSLFFEIYLQILQSSNKGKETDTEDVKAAYQQLGSLVGDLLQVLVAEQDSDNYELNFFEVWIQIFKTIGYLYQHQLIDAKQGDLARDFVEKFCSLQPVYQEALYPELHAKTEELTDKKDPQLIITFIKGFLGNFADIRRTYAIVDGFMNVLESGNCKTKVITALQASTATATTAFTLINKLKNPLQVHELLLLAVDYLTSHLNYGVFTGVTGANLDVVVKLDLGIQLTHILEQATMNNGENAFEAYLQSGEISNQDKEKAFSSLIKWTILNYTGSKLKSSPAGQRIFQLSFNVESLLQKISVSEELISVCLPALMKTILTADFKLRDLIHQQVHRRQANREKQHINYERAISIQKTVNTLFLSFFKAWVKSDAVAKKFLTELNGFDFLLDRLFSKTQTEMDQHDVALGLSTTLSKNYVSEDNQGLSNILFQEESNELSEEEDDQILNMALKKLEQFKELAKQPSASSVTKAKKKTLPKEITEPVKVSEAKQDPAEIMKDVEQKLTLDDYAKNLKLIWSSDRQGGVKAQYQAVQWHKYKNGTKNRLYNYIITDPQLTYEYVLKFDLDQEIMLNEVQIGVVYNWSTYDQDCNSEPLSLILEGSRHEEGPAEWRVIMHTINDDGYRMNSMTVYGTSFTDISKVNLSQNTLDSVLDKVGCKKARYLTFKFRRPVLACLDHSLYIAQVSKTKSYGISFVSTMGNPAPKSEHVFSYLLDIQKENSLEVLSKFFSSEFTEAFEIISEQANIIEKIKNAFDKLVQLMNTKASLIKPIFLAICFKNDSLGEWIMENRLISMDTNFIRKEQILFLGDIISSNKAKQLDKINTLKDFIFAHISDSGKRTEDQTALLCRYVKLFNKKIREYSLLQAGVDQELALSFTVEDLDNVIKLMSESTDKTKFFNALTELALVLLLPPKPLINTTISVDSYMEKLLENDEQSSLEEATVETKGLQNLLFCSIMAATDENAVQKILSKGKIEWLMLQLKKELSSATESSDGQITQYAQILFNCSKQKLFRDKFRTTLPRELYDLLKTDSTSEEAKTVLKPTLSGKQAVKLFVSTIRDVIVSDETQIEEFSAIMKEDLVRASEKGDVDFINIVIVPILHAEEKVPITISVIDEAALKKGDAKLRAIFASGEGAPEQGDSNFFLKTSILTKKQKTAFATKFKEISADKVDNFGKMVDSKWDLIFEDKAHQNQNPSKFRQFVKSVSNKTNVIIFVQCKVQEQIVVFGGYSNKPFPVLGETWAHEFDFQIPFSEANFVCYYTPEKELHYTMTVNKPFGYVYTDYEEGGALSVSGDFFLISWSYEFQNSCGNIYDMKCIEEPTSMSFYNNMEIQHIEVFSCDLGAKNTVMEGKLKSDMKKHALYSNCSPYNFFRQNLVFEVSKNLPLSHVADQILGKQQVFIEYPQSTAIEAATTVGDLIKQKGPRDSILDLVIMKKAEEPKAEEAKPPLPPPEQPSEPPLSLFLPEQPIMKKFEEKGGMLDLIKAAKAAVKIYKTDKLREMWSLWLSEVESFSQLPTFFQQFCADREKETIIYNLIQGQYDYTGEQKDAVNAQHPDMTRFIQQQEDLHIEMVKYTYKIVGQVFETHESAELRDNCLKNGTFEKFVERIGQLSSEKKRTKVDQSLKKPAEEDFDEADTTEKDSKNVMKKKKKKEDKKAQRKGVGYTTGQGTAWNVSEYLKSKEAKSSQAANIVNILKNMIKSKDWTAPPEIKDMLLESALLPTLEAAFRSGSLLEMAKEFDLNMAYLGFVQEIAAHPSLIDLVVDIGDDYEPRQKEPVNTLLSKLNDLGTIFLSCLTEDSKKSMDEEQAKPRQLAERIQETSNLVQQKLSQSTHQKAKQSLEDILAMPLSGAYWKLMAPMRFDYMAMKSSSGTYNHVYQGELHKATNPPVSKLVRLAQEIADLSNSLPCDYTNAIFCRVDKERVDVMKCMIMGASGTPYAHGAFLYDLFFENSYPNSPPKCQLVTTGGQTVRFNPNLYNNGKVCLSLLGTWRGSATENWDPKLSTILQVVLSVQAIIMSNEVYFNEPGYEHEAGTPDGERKNEGYANIVRYCNVKFAMIDAIKNPPPGFEKIIRGSFYLKKNEVLKEVGEWVEKSKKCDALYTGLVYDHNYHWAPQISAEGKYAEMMEAIYKELKETLEELTSPFEDEITGQKVERKFSDVSHVTETVKQDVSQTITKIEDIDVSYEPTGTISGISGDQTISIDDEGVKDRWSRYIGAMGIEAVAKQAQSRILISSLGPLGVEIAKNIILAGCKELILFDTITPLPDQLSGQFFLTEKDVEEDNFEKTSAHYSRDKLQQLNFYVKVTVLPIETVLTEYLASQKEPIKVVVITDFESMSREQYVELNKCCRANKVAMISASQNGLFGKIFNDFGPEFTVVDKDGEELQEVMIKDISYNEQQSATVVTLLDGFKHRFENGDQIVIKEVQGMAKLEGEGAINELICTVTVLNPQSFKIDIDSREYGPYEGNGIAKQIKVPKKAQFKSLEELETENTPAFDENLLISDFEKLDHKKISHYVYEACISMQGEVLDSYDSVELGRVLTEMVTALVPADLKETEKQQKLIAQLSHIFGLTMQFSFPPIAALLGGMVAQEIVKAITQKFMPIKQHFYFECSELFPCSDIASLSEEEQREQFVHEESYDAKDRYLGLKSCLGTDLFESIQDCKVFMIGAGAIGCELLKNYAMIGLGTGKEGQIFVTDPDVIEVSNLNRQFLFREKHLRKPKSQTAAAAAIQMNPELKGHISARLDKIHDGTSHIYNEDFFQGLTIVTNALDNVQARLFIDGKCVAARTPLIDSGTLGPKGHVQIVLPEHLTESYSSQRDPDDNTGEIPHCTLKMFPEETLHCVEWAKDLFGNLFMLIPQSFNKLIIEEKGKEINFFDQQEKAALKKVIKIIEDKPTSFADCLQVARVRFQKHFVNDIKQLLHVYPLDKLTKEGRPFWSLPKRAPRPIDFNSENPTHAQLVASFACLLAKMHSIEIPFDKPRSKEARHEMALKASAFPVKDFVPNDQKASQIESQVEKEQTKGVETNQDQEESQQQTMAPTSNANENDELIAKYKEVILPLKQSQETESLGVEEFEKDNDANFHVDFIHAFANVRAQNYKLDEMDWITVKIKAGKIVPALATTTAFIAALQTIELIRYLKEECPLEQYRNSFLNLAVPSLMQSEPGKALKTKLKVGLEVTLWDRWEYEVKAAMKDKVTLKNVVEYFEKQHELEVRDVFYGSIPLYMHALNLGKDRNLVLDKEPLLTQVHPTLSPEARAQVATIDLTLTFINPKATTDDKEKMLEGIPPIRVLFAKK